MTQEVFDKQYGYTFVKNKSDINLNKAGLTPLTESEIDKTIMKEKNHFDQGTMPSPVQNFVIHHTAGRGTAKGVVGTFQNRGYPAQYIIDRDGIIHQYMPNGAFAWHAGSYNRRAMGVEVIGDNDKDITKKQIEAAVRLAQYLGFSRDQIIGHGQVPGADKAADEGKTITDYIKTLV
jgi:N-acetyl-anhydromuramyl-L-alanine amidase AmpD